MPLDVILSQTTLPVDAAELHGIPRHVLVRHAMARLTRDQRRALIAVEIEDGGGFVNMGMNFDSVAWRAVWRLPGLPEAAGMIPVWKGEIVA
jgi:hypothetical protein